MKKDVALSVIIPARNEEVLIVNTLKSVLKSAGYFVGLYNSFPDLTDSPAEVIVVDNNSTDQTLFKVLSFSQSYGVKCISYNKIKAPCARNAGYKVSKGMVLVFIDADTIIPYNALETIWRYYTVNKFEAGIFRLASLEGGIKAKCWRTFWNHVRRLPLSKAKAMPAFMFCSRNVFKMFGPFDEHVEIAEEWPIISNFYRHYPEKFICDRTLTALSSNRRMELQRFGYIRTFLKYVWAILHQSGRLHFTDSIRHISE